MAKKEQLFRDYYAANIRFLDPELVDRLKSIEPHSLTLMGTAYGPSILMKGLLLHSLDDPRGEAREFISGYRLEPGTLTIVLGLGLGYHIFELYSQLGTRGKIVVIEESLSIFKMALELQNLITILTAKNIELIVGLNKEEVIGRLRVTIGLDKIGQVKVIAYPPSFQLSPEYYGYLRRTIEGGLEARLANLTTQALYGEMWLRNILLNLAQIINHPPVDALYGKFSGKPAIIISAGPSLDKNIKCLNMAKGRALLMSVDTALRPMLSKGIKPDLIVSVDPQEVKYAHIEGLKTKGMHLVADGIASFLVFASFEGKKLIAGHGHPLMNWIYSYLEFGELKTEPLRTGGSVATAAFDLARKIGTDPIILVGQDLSFPIIDQFHAGDVAFLGERHDKLNKSNAFLTKDIFGRDVFTTRRLVSCQRWFEEEVRHTQAKCINATEGGILKQGFIQMDLDEAIRTYCKVEIDIEGFLSQAQDYYPRVDRVGLRRGMEDMRDELIFLRGLCQEAIEAIDSGDNKLDRINREINDLGVTRLIKETIEGILWQSSKDTNIKSFYKQVSEMSNRMERLVEEVVREL
ncbi:TPA: hypothetical protein DCX15_02260 [bacterium]|nr:hypothetical protein [bacterium]